MIPSSAILLYYCSFLIASCTNLPVSTESSIPHPCQYTCPSTRHQEGLPSLLLDPGDCFSQVAIQFAEHHIEYTWQRLFPFPEIFLYILLQHIRECCIQYGIPVIGRRRGRKRVLVHRITGDGIVGHCSVATCIVEACVIEACVVDIGIVRQQRKHLVG